jgi:hypothetical protein
MNYIKGFFGRFFNNDKNNPIKSNDWIQTSSGRKFHIFSPKEEDVVIEDAAHALSLQCRFNGHTPELYSVAQHSIYVSMMCSPENALCGLLHDLPEAYIGDMATPLKKQMNAFKQVEECIWETVSTKYGLPKKMSAEIKECDKKAFRMEWAYLMGGKNLEGEKFLVSREEFNKKTPVEVEMEFISLFYKLLEQHNKMLVTTV